MAVKNLTGTREGLYKSGATVGSPMDQGSIHTKDI